MLTRVDVLSETPFYLNIADARPTDSIIVDKIEGLTPPAADLYMGEFARDGGFYSGRRVGPRNVVITLTINPQYSKDETVDELRELVYRAFMDPMPGSDEIQLLLRDDKKPLRVVGGYSEKIEAEPFSNDLTMQISMICPNPYILGYESREILSGGPLTLVDYPGSAETGFVADITMTSSSGYLYLSVSGRPPMILKYGFQFGDKIKINSNAGSLRVQLTRGSTTTDILYATTANSQWQYLRGKNNSVRVYGEPTPENPTPVVATLEKVTYRAAYWGI